MARPSLGQGDVALSPNHVNRRRYLLPLVPYQQRGKVGLCFGEVSHTTPSVKGLIGSINEPNGLKSREPSVGSVIAIMASLLKMNEALGDKFKSLGRGLLISPTNFCGPCFEAKACET
jgi:hypothetical protein